MLFVIGILHLQGQSGIFDGKTRRIRLFGGIAAAGAAGFHRCADAAELYFDGNFFALTPYAQPDFLTRGNRTHHNGQVAGGAHFLAVDAAHDVAHLQTGLGRRTVGHDFGDQCAAGLVQTERFG